MRELESKRVKISGKKFKVFGSKKDRYFNEYLGSNKDFFDTPVVYLEKYAAPDSTILDIGANIGLVSLSASVLSPEGTIYAIEASPVIYKILEKNLSGNPSKNVKPIHIALSNKKDTLDFFEDTDFLAGSRVVPSGTHSSHKIIKVPAVPLDQLVKELGIDKIDIIKLDVEGHEEQVLDGARKTIKKFKPFCLIEFNSYVMIHENRQLPQDFLEYLKDLFPRIYLFDRQTLGLTEITDSTDDFLTNNLLNGCVDDLVCGFDDLPTASKWFQKNR